MFLSGIAAAAGCRAANGVAGEADALLPPRTDPNLSVLISDIHVPLPWSEQKYRTGREYPWIVGTIRRFVDEILALRPRPAYVFGFGDVSIAFSEEREYEMAAELLKPEASPTSATNVPAVTGPTPGMVISRHASGTFSRASARASLAASRSSSMEA